MASRDPSNSVDKADAFVCRSAALLLRAGQEVTLVGAELVPPLDRLLTAVSLELETNRGSVPASVRCAAARLAEHVVKRSSIPVPRTAVSAREPDTLAQADRRRTARTARRATVPFARSIRLGRMG
ncbi:hypothetical protein ACVGOW_19870 [Pseudonocardia saturnea]